VRRLDRVLCLTTNRPAEVPEETTKSGVIRPTKQGFTVFGEPFVLDRGGKVAPGK
jgi:hypothetical protein